VAIDGREEPRTGDLAVELEALTDATIGMDNPESGSTGGDGPLNPMFEARLTALVTMNLCQVCRPRNRDTIIVSRGHAVCRFCRETTEPRAAV
jgi:hypothetical protein